MCEIGDRLLRSGACATGNFSLYRDLEIHAHDAFVFVVRSLEAGELDC